jgi:hypothetical protein
LQVPKYLGLPHIVSDAHDDLPADGPGRLALSSRVVIGRLLQNLSLRR